MRAQARLAESVQFVEDSMAALDYPRNGIAALVTDGDLEHVGGSALLPSTPAPSPPTR